MGGWGFRKGWFIHKDTARFSSRHNLCFIYSEIAWRQLFDLTCMHTRQQKPPRHTHARAHIHSPLAYHTLYHRQRHHRLWGVLLCHISHTYISTCREGFSFLFAVIKLWQYTDIFLATMNNTPSSRPHGKSTWASVNTASYLTGKMRCCEAYERACELMRVFSLWWQAHSTIGVDALIYVVRGKRVRGGGVRWLKSLSAQLYCFECRVCHHSNRKEIFFFFKS